MGTPKEGGIWEKLEISWGVPTFSHRPTRGKTSDGKKPMKADGDEMNQVTRKKGEGEKMKRQWSEARTEREKKLKEFWIEISEAGP